MILSAPSKSADAPIPSFDQIPCPILVTDSAGVVQSLNQDLLLLIGSDKERWLTKSMELMFPMASRIFLHTHVWPMIFRDGQVREIRLQLLDSGGNSLPVFVNCQKTSQEGIDRFTWVLFVTIERSRFEQALLESRQRTENISTALTKSEAFIRGVFEATSEGIMVTDSDATIISVNPAFAKLTGYSQEEVIGQNARILKSDRHDADFFLATFEILQKNKIWNGEVWSQRKDGSIFLGQLSISAICDQNDVVLQYVVLCSDITERWDREQLIHQMALHDGLTGLPNRTLLMERLGQIIAKSQRDSRQIALMFLDLDGFKKVNDTLGHSIGDEVLKTVATRLSSLLRNTDTVARLGGDEFVLLLDNPENSEAMAQIGARVISIMNEPMQFDNAEAHIGVSIGIAVFKDRTSSPEALLKRADEAMYAAKAAGKNVYRFAE
ncbi:sensor domain-containing diguanylate cyclase [uncultured Deefgea sp.]|uniref:sensor domain-containing diguanylate cyclase n=1 Tax=uncultured Deefgea sp. TaxID=1304914 RepID=UPI002630808A|nr:sensor domain-containing diguanylate cyclase [uncultured Deefgea sp.]